MRKMLSILIVIALFVPVICFAESSPKDFVLGDDVKFGMTMDEVKSRLGRPSQSNDAKLVYTEGVTFAG